MAKTGKKFSRNQPSKKFKSGGYDPLKSHYEDKVSERLFVLIVVIVISLASIAVLVPDSSHTIIPAILFLLGNVTGMIIEKFKTK